MAKTTDRVKQSTKRFKKRKGFCKKIVSNSQDNDVPESSVNTVNTPPVNIVNTPPRPVPVLRTPFVSPDGYVVAQTISQKKIQRIVSETPKSTDSVSGYRFMDLEILNSVINTLVCPECNEKKLKLKENVG